MFEATEVRRMKGGFTRHFNEYDYGDDNPYIYSYYMQLAARPHHWVKVRSIDISSSAQQTALNAATAVRDSGTGEVIHNNDATGHTILHQTQ